jgi:phosphomannomutase
MKRKLVVLCLLIIALLMINIISKDTNNNLYLPDLGGVYSASFDDIDFSTEITGMLSEGVIDEVIYEEAFVENSYSGEYKNNLLRWGILRKGYGVTPDADPGAPELLEKYGGKYIGDTGKNEIYLTFDEGYENGYTSKILDVLRENNVKAIFFITGPYLSEHQDLVRRMVEEGHVVGNHTIHHPSLPSVDDKALEEEILGLDRAFFENAFAREDFSRCEGDMIKEVEVVPDFTSFYLRNIINNAKNKSFEYKIALNSPSKFILSTVSGLLKNLGCTVEETNLNFEHSRKKERNESNELNYFTSMVKMGNFDFGVSIEDTSERMMLVDNKGKVINEDMFTALVSLILFKTTEGGTVVVPLSTTHVVEKLAEENQGKVLRTKTSPQDVMNSILGNEIKEDSIEQFNFHYDAISGLVKIMDFLKSNNYKLADLVGMIPDFYTHEKEVECSWNAKGKVMRQIIQESDNNSIETLEGVKIFKDGSWVLILPDAEQPVCRIKSESYSAEIAQELTSFYADKVTQISNT